MGNVLTNNNDKGNLTSKNNYDIMFIGPSASGKTSLINSFLNIECSDTDIMPNINMEKHNYHYNQNCFIIWDSIGISKYRNMTLSYYQNIHTFIIVINDKIRNYLDEINTFYHLILEHGHNHKLIYVILYRHNIKNIYGFINIVDINDIIIFCNKLNPNIRVIETDNSQFLNDIINDLINI